MRPATQLGGEWRGNEWAVAYAPSNVKDVAAGKSFIFMPIVVRNAMGTLVRAVSRHVSTPPVGLSIHREESRCGTRERYDGGNEIAETAHS